MSCLFGINKICVKAQHPPLNTQQSFPAYLCPGLVLALKAVAGCGQIYPQRAGWVGGWVETALTWHSLCPGFAEGTRRGAHLTCLSPQHPGPRRGGAYPFSNPPA